MLVCRDAAAEIEFCKAALAAEELSRRTAAAGVVVQAVLRLGGSMIMIHGEFPILASRSPQPDGTSPVVIVHYVDDVDAVIERAVLAGATVLIPAQNQAWGDRVGRILDPAGHVWNISAHLSR